MADETQVRYDPHLLSVGVAMGREAKDRDMDEIRAKAHRYEMKNRLEKPNRPAVRRGSKRL